MESIFKQFLIWIPPSSSGKECNSQKCSWCDVVLFFNYSRSTRMTNALRMIYKFVLVMLYLISQYLIARQSPKAVWNWILTRRNRALPRRLEVYPRLLWLWQRNLLFFSGELARMHEIRNLIGSRNFVPLSSPPQLNHVQRNLKELNGGHNKPREEKRKNTAQQWCRAIRNWCPLLINRHHCQLLLCLVQLLVCSGSVLEDRNIIESDPVPRSLCKWWRE